MIQAFKMIKNTLIILLGFAMFAPSVHAECIPLNGSLNLISDRYDQIATHDNFIYLARGDLLVVRDAQQADLPILTVFECPDRITSLQAEGATLWVLMEETGILPLNLQSEAPWLIEGPLLSLSESELFVLDGQRLIVGKERTVHFYEEQEGSWTRIATHLFESRVKKIALDGNRFIALLDQGSLYRGVIEQAGEIELRHFEMLDDKPFYSFEWLADDPAPYLVLDAAEGLIKANLSDAFTVQSAPVLFRNQGSDLVLNVRLFEDHLFVRFPDSIKWYLLEGDRMVLRDQLSFSLADYGIPKLEVQGDRLYILNGNDLPTNWSLLGYDLNLPFTSPQVEIATSMNQIKGFVFENNQLFFAIDDTLFQYPWNAEATFDPDEFEEIQTFQTYVLSMVSISQGFVLTINNRERNGTDLLFFSTQGGAVQQTQSIFYQKGVQNLKSANNLLTFQNVEIIDQSKVLTIYLLKLIDGEWVEKTYQQSFEVEELIPLTQFTPAGDSVFFIDGSNVSMIEFDSGLKQTVYASAEDIVALGRVEDTLLIETRSGVIHLNPGLLAGAQESAVLGIYPDWYDLAITLNSIALAKSRKIPGEGSYDILAMDDRQFLFPVSRIQTGVVPNHIEIKNLKLLMQTPFTLKIFDYVCPALPNQYIWPSFSNLELDLNTNFDANDLISWDFWDEDGKHVGRSFVEASLIRHFNGHQLAAWPFSLNSQHNAEKITVRASFPLWGVLSGTANGINRFSVPFSGELFPRATLAHVASSTNGWSNHLYLQFHPFRQNISMDINWGGTESFSLPIPEEEFGIFEIPQDFQSEESPPWLSIEVEGFNSGLTGFNLFSIGDQAAATLLENSSSDFFVIPVLRQSDLIDWQGIAVNNPDPSVMFIRFIGYNAQGQIVLDRADQIEPYQKLVTDTADLLPSYQDNSVVWMNLITERPTTAISVLGNLEHGSIASFSLKPQFGRTLMLPGLRIPEIDPWLLLINTESVVGHSTLRVYGSTGSFLGQVVIPFGEKATSLHRIRDLFPELFSGDPANIQTMIIQSSTDTAGVCIRQHPSDNKIEAFRLFALP